MSTPLKFGSGVYCTWPLTIWAVPFGALIILLRKQWPEVRLAFATPRVLFWLFMAALFIAVNWYVYIFAVQREQVYQASLGYYINPLMYVLVGVAFLGMAVFMMIKANGGEEFELPVNKTALVVGGGVAGMNSALGLANLELLDAPARALPLREAALRLTGGSAETIHCDFVRTAFNSNARLAIAPLQDYLGLGSEARFNVPGTSSNNWRWRLQAPQLSPAVRGQVAALVEESGRSLQN